MQKGLEWLLTEFPPQQALTGLLVRRPDPETSRRVAMAVCDLQVAKRPMLVAGLWVYADDLEAAHQIVQNDSTDESSWWHAIVHRREGDYGNSLYWYRQAARHPLIDSLPVPPESIVRLAQQQDPRAVKLQQQEWELLVTHCAQQA